jgi:uncharacterized protein (DUF924 family)
MKSYHWIQHAEDATWAAEVVSMITFHPFPALGMCFVLVACDRAPAVVTVPGEAMVPVAPPAEAPQEAREVVAFWKEAGPKMWFAKDPEFDRRFRQRFLALHEAAARGELDAWNTTAEGALALQVLLDQFPRNSFRGTPRMYATDEKARAAAHLAVERGLDLELPVDLRLFVYLPFGHSESLIDQERSVTLARQHLRPVEVGHAERHRDIVRRFGRFPHRNPILGRTMRPEEQKFLDDGGFAG